MIRYTKPTAQGYLAEDPEAAIARLGVLEDRLEAVEVQLHQALEQMAALSQAGKTKTATYRQFFAQKLSCLDCLGRMGISVSQGENRFSQETK